MRRWPLAAVILMVAAAGARAQDDHPLFIDPAQVPPSYDAPRGAWLAPNEPEGDGQQQAGGPAAIPRHTEGTAVRAPGGGYCYAGPHPVNRDVAAGGPFDDDNSLHTHSYAPIDLRLFALVDRCYQFIGDPADFGYQGPLFDYFDAHPIAPMYGGGWCYMSGGHQHGWQPFSPFFVPFGSHFYWRGVYDASYQTYLPYYSYYFRSHYPRYYQGGRFVQRRGAPRAPPIMAVPAPVRPRPPPGDLHAPPQTTIPGPSMRMPSSAPARTQGYRGAPAGVAAPMPSSGPRMGGGFRGGPPSSAPGPARTAPSGGGGGLRVYRR